jgi:hypothetical protein
MKSRFFSRALTAVLICIAGFVSFASAQTLRIATYNVNADTSSSGSGIGSVDGGTGLVDVLQAIGQHHLGDGVAQPIDVLALQELNDGNGSISPTLTYLVTQLNSLYGAGTYAYDTFVDATTGGTGGGPSGLIYNTHTVTDVSHQQVGSASGSGAPRAPMRYTLKPVNGPAYSQFYLYVSHAKSGTDSTSANRRNVEAGAIRSNAAALTDFDGLPYAHVVYTGDWNLNSSSEAAYQTLVSASPSPGQAIDTAIPSNVWSDGQSIMKWESEKATKMQYRDDLQLVTAPVGTGSGVNLTMPGLQMVPGSLEVFGNNGSASYLSSVTSSSNTALSDLSNRSTILNDLTTATDHLPVVADYTIVPPGDLNRDGHVNAADISSMMTALSNIPAYESSIGFTGVNADAMMMEIGDINGDHVFNNADLQSLVNFLQSGGGTESMVPEPASLTLLMLAAPALLALRNRRRAIAC